MITNVVIFLHDLHQSKLSLTAVSHTYTDTHTHTYEQTTMHTSRERAVTNRSKADKDSVSQLFFVLGSKEKEKCVRITEKKCVKMICMSNTGNVSMQARGHYDGSQALDTSHTPPPPQSLLSPLLFVSVTLIYINYTQSWDNNTE